MPSMPPSPPPAHAYFAWARSPCRRPPPITPARRARPALARAPLTIKNCAFGQAWMSVSHTAFLEAASCPTVVDRSAPPVAPQPSTGALFCMYELPARSPRTHRARRTNSTAHSQARCGPRHPMLQFSGHMHGAAAGSLCISPSVLASCYPTPFFDWSRQHCPRLTGLAIQQPLLHDVQL